ncbi:hypothetical protein [Mucilaginibacter lacusdianchii]|uniref:hypothetical protein n=1 Tax=Mucilaginibacter lacusdianchii TaxID=2684211 RepID=UPI00131B900D|nr:hypothetical protein [Mucilaginibacter sp. JXJ CY 39]
MKRPDENKLDKLFKDGLTGSENHVPFREDDWQAMEKLLDKKPERKVIAFRWMYYASGIAAMLLLAVGMFLLIRKNKPSTQPPKIVKQKITPNNNYKLETNNDPSGQQLPNPAASLSANRKVPGGQRVLSRNSNPFLSLSAARIGRYHNKLPKSGSAGITDSVQATFSDSIHKKQEPILLAITKPAIADSAHTPHKDTAAAMANKPMPKETEKKKLKPIVHSRPQVTLSILAAPDVNGVGSFGRSQVGTNFGVLAGVQLTKKLAISTGVAYAIKPYDTYNADYNSSFQPSVPPTNIAANCKVLDIPVNVSYQLFSRGRDAFTVGTGLSSYLMLRERYRFDYALNPEMQPFNLNITNGSRHWFGVLNLNVTYQRQLNNRFNLLVQPYYKLPLTGIGNGRVDLRSAGVAVGASFNINPFGKPK